jgi:hypothetical protein
MSTAVMICCLLAVFVGSEQTGILLREVETICYVWCLVFSEVCDIFFQCGEPSNVYRGYCDKCVIMNLCSNCNMVRHPHTLCPEMWRMYHSVVRKIISVAHSFHPFVFQMCHILQDFT